MFLIEKTELLLVSGGGDPKEEAGAAFAIGTAWGAASIIKEAGGFANVASGLRLAVGGAAAAGVYASYRVGDAIGTAIYSSETVQKGIAAAVDWAFGTWDMSSGYSTERKLEDPYCEHVCGGI